MIIGPVIGAAILLTIVVWVYLKKRAARKLQTLQVVQQTQSPVQVYKVDKAEAPTENSV